MSKKIDTDFFNVMNSILSCKFNKKNGFYRRILKSSDRDILNLVCRFDI